MKHTTIQHIDLQHFTRLPLKSVLRSNSFFSELLVTTPHKGVVIVPVKELKHGLFSAPRQIDRNLDSVLRQLADIESDATDFLFRQWTDTLPNHE